MITEDLTEDPRYRVMRILATVESHREDPLWVQCTKFQLKGSSVCLRGGIFYFILNCILSFVIDRIFYVSIFILSND